MTRILGIDPGLTNLGWAVIESSGSARKYIASGVIKPPSAAASPMHSRLKFIFDAVAALCETWSPNECAIEIIFVNKNPKTTLILGHARAAAIVAIANADIVIFEYEPNKIKKAIACAGHADKTAIARMVKMLLPMATPKTTDESDAIAIALAHSNIRR